MPELAFLLLHGAVGHDERHSRDSSPSLSAATSQAAYAALPPRRGELPGPAERTRLPVDERIVQIDQEQRHAGTLARPRIVPLNSDPVAPVPAS